MAIITVDELQSRYNIKISDRTVVQTMLDTAEEACLKYAGVITGVQDEFFDGGCNSVVLKYGPVVAVKAVEVAGHAVLYRYESRSRKIVFHDEVAPGRDRIRITYLCGWEEHEVPPTLQTAVALTVQHMLKLTNGKMMGTLSRTTDLGSEQIEQSIPPIAVKGLLEHFRSNVL